MGVLGVAALGLANGDELVQGPGFQVIFGKRELTRRSAPAGVGEAGKHGRQEGGVVEVRITLYIYTQKSNDRGS